MKTTKILCIGNSFSEDATALLNPMLASYVIDTIVVNLFIGGCSLQQHWENIQYKKQDYLYMKNGVGISPGNPNGRMVSINEVILEEEWDIVTIQQSSLESGIEKSFHPYIDNLVEYINENLKYDFKLWLHQPWAWQSNLKQEKMFKKNYQSNEEVMHQNIKTVYNKVSSELNIPLIPSGNLIYYLRRNTEFDYNAKNGISLSRDGIHMHEIFGRYVLSLLWSHVLFSVDINLCKFYPSNITDNDIIIINKIKFLCKEFIQIK